MAVATPGRRSLHGWGRTAPSVARVHQPDSVTTLRERLLSAGPRGVIPRGLGRSYGDAAQNGGGDVLETLALPRDLDLDTGTGWVSVGAGMSLRDLIGVLLPHGFFVPVT